MDFREDEFGDFVVASFELPLYSGETSEIFEELRLNISVAEKNLHTLHLLNSLWDSDDPAVNEEMDKAYRLAINNVTYAMIALASIAENEYMDINRNILENF